MSWKQRQRAFISRLIQVFFAQFAQLRHLWLTDY